MLSLLSSILLSAFLGAPSSTPLLTLESARGAPGHWNRLVVVYQDGRWTAGPESGRLGAERLASLRVAAMQVPPKAAGPRPLCRARPFAFLAVTTPRGRFVQGTPCGTTWAPEVADLAAFLEGLGKPTPKVRFEEANVHGGAWTTRAIIFADGRWEARNEKGQLGAEELATLDRALAAATFRLAEDGEFRCAAIPTTRYRLSAGGREVVWDAPCGDSPDEATVDFMRIVGDLTRAE